MFYNRSTGTRVEFLKIGIYQLPQIISQPGVVNRPPLQGLLDLIAALLDRLGAHRYAIEDAFDPQPVFEFVRSEGNVSDEEMYRIFNMGTGFVAALDPDAAESLAAETDGRVIGRVESAERGAGEDGATVAVRGLKL